jgi:hypothetical protein
MSCLLMILIMRIEPLEGKGVVVVVVEVWREGLLFRFLGRLVEVDKAVLERLDIGVETFGECFFLFLFFGVNVVTFIKFGSIA